MEPRLGLELSKKFKFYFNIFNSSRNLKASITLPKICQLSWVTHFQVYRPCLQVAHWNTHVNGANFVVNRHKTLVNTLKSQYTPFKLLYTAFLSARKVNKKPFFVQVLAKNVIL